MIDDSKRLSIIVPARNEAQSLPILIEKLLRWADLHAVTIEIIVINDGSSDQSETILNSLAAADSRIHCIHFPLSRGKSAAWLAGFEHASGEIICTIDADLQDDPEDLSHLWPALLEGNDIVCGFRTERQEPFWTRILPSLVANYLLQKLFRSTVKDLGCGLKVISKSALRDLPRFAGMHRFLAIIVESRGGRLKNVPVRSHKRHFGKSHYGLGRIFILPLDALRVLYFLRKKASIPDTELKQATAKSH